MLEHNDTIVAQATPPGRGGVGIIRVSGPKARDVAAQVVGKELTVRRAEYLSFNDADGKALDQGIALYFQAPNSFTGEDVLELQGHGGPVLMDMLIKRIVAIDGIRTARPGEFSERAFLNDKLDLAQAEAIAEALPALLKSGRLDAKGLNSLGVRIRTIFRETIPLARGALLLSRHRRLRKLVFRGLSRARALFCHLLEVNMGRVRWYRLSPATLLWFVAGLLRPKVTQPLQRGSPKAIWTPPRGSGAMAPFNL